MKSARPIHPAPPDQRGFVVLYRPTEINRCPGCGGTHWWVGRSSAECHRCHTALPLMSPLTPGITTEGNN